MERAMSGSRQDDGHRSTGEGRGERTTASAWIGAGGIGPQSSARSP
jgi:hypothetical protein